MNEFYQYPFGDYQIIQTPNLWQTYQNYNYIVAKGNEAVVIDPGELEPIANSLAKNGLDLCGIYLTHHHHDHTGATEELAAHWKCPVYGFSQDKHRLPKLSREFSEGDSLSILGLDADVLFLPGHTLGLCAFYVKEMNWLFCNDALFSIGCGRVFEGTHQQMHKSLQKIMALPNETLLFCSHEYTESNLNFAVAQFPKNEELKSLQDTVSQKLKEKTPTVPTTLAFEKQHNPFLRCDHPEVRQALGMPSQEAWQVFAELRTRKDHF